MNESIFSLIPVRSLDQGKTRLAPDFSESERRLVIREMLTGVVRAALATPHLAEVAVISSDPAVLSFAGEIDKRVVPVVQASSRSGLNPAIEIGRERAINAGGDGLLVLFGDLPLIGAAAVEKVLVRPETVILASDRHRSGTNASLVRFVDGGEHFVYQYGPGSLLRHQAEARRLGLTCGEIAIPELANDLDTAADWVALGRQDRRFFWHDPRWHVDVELDAASGQRGA